MAKVKCPRCHFVNPDGQEHCVQCRQALPKVRIQPDPPQQRPAPAAQQGIALKRGQMVARRYTVTGMIGRGGMGCIYKVYDNVLGEDVALKTLLPQFVQEKTVVERFFNEARIARKLAHPNIVRVHDIGSADNFVYISMEYVKGQSLRHIIEHLPSGQRLPVSETLRVLDQLAAALEYAHQYTIHRDIKPENVMLDEDGTVKLMDFGISKLMTSNQLTGASMVMGTPFYMSPEQLRNSRDVDARADIFSVGVMLYEILTGNMPTGVPRPASHLEEGVPPALDAIVARCVDPNPDRRYANATELRAALRELRDQLSGDSMVARPPARVAAAPPREWPWRQMAGGALLVLLLVFVATGLYALEARQSRLAAEAEAEAEAEAGGERVAVTGGTASESLDDLIAYLDDLSKRIPSRGDLLPVFEQGKSLLAGVRDLAARDPERARERARDALQYLLAPELARPGMVFVPPGQVRSGNQPVQVPGFFIDTREVTVGEFLEFTRNVEGGWRFPFDASRLSAQDQELPMVRLTQYDAAAFAAHRGKLLPTQDQWLRAAMGDEGRPYPWGSEPKQDAANVKTGVMKAPGSFEQDVSPFGCLDMAGNVAEWTRTPQQAVPEGALLFGVPMAYKGGDYLASLMPSSESRYLAYEQAADHLGFRCVIEIPVTRAGARAVLGN